MEFFELIKPWIDSVVALIVGYLLKGRFERRNSEKALGLQELSALQQALKDSQELNAVYSQDLKRMGIEHIALLKQAALLQEKLLTFVENEE